MSTGKVAVRALLVLRRLSQGPATKQDLEAYLKEKTGERVNDRTLRRSLEYIRKAGFTVEKDEKLYRLGDCS